MGSIFQNRVFEYNSKDPKQGPVIYWMSRDQRIRDNQALLYAQEIALERKVPLVILFCLSPSFPGATLRHYDFMLGGLKKVETDARKLNIPFILKYGDSVRSVLSFTRDLGAGMIVTDFSPLRIHLDWKFAVAEKCRVPLHEVDAHNVVPCRVASPKLEFAARTIRPKIARILDEYLIGIPVPVKHPWTCHGDFPVNDWVEMMKCIKADRSVSPVEKFLPGESAASKVLERFITRRLSRYDTDRNDPGIDGQSDLSPYLHFGQISAQRVALEVQKTGRGESAAAFIEELIVRKELSDNFCLYNAHYDSFEGIPAWGKQTLRKHWSDHRPYLYSQEQFESATTHDPLWNSAQKEMTATGKMHGYMRMYWAKKILEWSIDPEEAFQVAVYLNDRYSLDGHDPNGYAGISWSIGGTHDRPWGERPIFGTVRYMTYEGCRRKFDVGRYIAGIQGYKDIGIDG